MWSFAEEKREMRMKKRILSNLYIGRNIEEQYTCSQIFGKGSILITTLFPFNNNS